ncbi:TPA: RidA family protein [Enterobacter asburiae]|nr:RidA family protein [Enterobacter asburiae]
MNLPPPVPDAAGKYIPFTVINNMVYINQIALKDGQIKHPGKIGLNVSEEQTSDETKQTAINIIYVLNKATDGNLNRVERVVQLTGIFNTTENFERHADIMNSASELMILLFGENGKHTRATYGAVSPPLNSTVEIQTIF